MVATYSRVARVRRPGLSRVRFRRDRWQRTEHALCTVGRAVLDLGRLSPCAFFRRACHWRHADRENFRAAEFRRRSERDAQAIHDYDPPIDLGGLRCAVGRICPIGGLAAPRGRRRRDRLARLLFLDRLREHRARAAPQIAWFAVIRPVAVYAGDRCFQCRQPLDQIAYATRRHHPARRGGRELHEVAADECRVCSGTPGRAQAIPGVHRHRGRRRIARGLLGDNGPR